MTADEAVARMRRAGVVIDVIGGLPILSGPRKMVDLWRPYVRRYRKALVRLLVPLAVPQPSQPTLPGLSPARRS